MADDFGITDADLESAANTIATRRAQAVNRGLEQDPDKAANAMQLSETTGRPAPAILDNYDQYTDDLKGLAAREIVNSNPALRSYVDREPMASAISADDWPTLDDITKGNQQDTVLMRMHRALNAPFASTDPMIDEMTTAFKQGYGSGYDPERANKITERYGSLAAAGDTAAAEALHVLPGLFNGFLSAAAAGTADIPGFMTLDRLMTGGVERSKEAAVGELTSNLGAVLMDEGANAAAPKGPMLAGLKAGLPWFEVGRDPPKGLHPELDRAKADLNAEAMTELDQKLAQALTSTTRERSPEMFSKLLGHDFGDTEFELAATGARSLYADGERPHAGDSRLGDIPGVAEQWDEMLADPSGKTGIGIKDRDWLAHVLPEVNDAVKDDRRMWPGGITAREAAEEPPVTRAIVDAPLAQVRAATGTEPLIGMGDRALTLDSGTVTEAGEHGFTLKDENGAEVGSIRVIPPDADGVLRVTGVDGPAQLWSDTFGPALTRDLKRQLAGMYPDARTIEAVRPEGAEPKQASLDLTGPETVESHKAMQEVLGHAGHPDVGVNFAGPGEAGNEYKPMVDLRGRELSPMAMDKHWSSVRDETGAKLGTNTDLPEWFHDVKAVLKTLADKLGYTFNFPVLVGTTRGSFGTHYNTGHIILSDKLARADAIATGLHEFGHSVELNKFTGLSMADKQAIIDAWKRSPSKGKTARELRPLTESDRPDGSSVDLPIEKLADETHTYLTNFREWFAEQVSRWITKNESPTGVVEKFFHGIAQVWRAIYEKVTGHYGVAPEIDAFMRKNWKGEVDIQLPRKVTGGGGSGGGPPKPPTEPGAPQPTPGRQPLEDFVQSLVNQTMASTSEMQAKAVGITAKSWEKLKTLMAKQSEDDINANLKRAARAEAERQKPEWTRKLAEVTQEVSTGLSKRRDIALDRFLGEGMVGDQKVQQRFTLREADLTPEQVAALPEHYVSKNGLPVAAVGKQLGYHTIEEMVADLNKLHQARLKPDGSRMRMSDYMRKLIQDESAKEMERRHGNFQDNVMEAAMKQVTSENQVARIHAEYEAAAQAAGQKAIDKKVIAQAARNMLDGTLVKKVGSFEAMQKAGALGKKAHEALIAGKPLEMFNHLQGQTLLMHVAKAMRDVEDEIAEFEKNAKTDLKRTPKGRDFEYTDYLHEIYIKLGMKPRRSIEDIKRQHELREGQPIKTLEEFVNEKTANGAEIFPMPEMFDPAYAVKWKEMTTEDFLAAKSFIDSMRVAAKDQHQVNIFGQHLLIDAIMPDMLMAGDKYKEYLSKTAEDTKVSDARRMFSSVVMPQFLVNRLDGWLSTGAWNKYFMNMLQSGYGDKLRYQRELAKVMQQIADRPEWKEGIENPGIFMMPKEHGGLPMEMTRENLIAAMLNIGTKSGLKQLARGFGIKKPAVIEAWIHENAKEEDWDFVRTVWNDVFKRTGGWVEEMYAREGLRVPRMLSGRTIDTPFGPVEGAYYPIIYDRVMGTPRYAKGMGDQALYGGKLTESFMPASGYTKDRLGSGNRISLSLDLLPAKAEEQIHDAAMRPAVRNALKILGRPEIEKMFNTRIGREYYDSLLATVKRAAGQDTASAKQSATMQVVSKWLDWATHRMIGSLIGFNPGTFVKHGTSALVNSAQSVGVRPFLAALKDLHEIGPEGDKLRAFVAEHSDAMRERNRTVMNSFYGSTQEVTQPKSGWETWQSNINDAGHAPVIWGDSVSAAPTFVAAFRRAKKNGLSDGQAVLEADTAIRTTHGSTSDINKSTMMAELPTWLSWFGNFFNDLTNRGIESFYKAGEAQRLWKDGSPESMTRAKQLAWQSTSQLLVAVVVPALIHRFMDPDIHKKGESLPWYMAKEAIYDTTMFIPGLRELGHYLTGTQSPTIGALSSIMEVPGRLYKDFDSSKWQTPQAREREIKDTLMLFGTALGLPGGAMGNAGSALYGLATGQERPQGFMDVWRLATRGTTKAPKKE